jgi:heat shock protein HtpX
MMGLWQLRLGVLATLATIIGLSTLFFTALLIYAFGTSDLVVIGAFVIGFNIIQWLVAPYLIGALYHVREVPKSENPKLHQMVEDLSQKSGLKKPRVMLANIPIANAFAYGSPIAGTRIAVTSGLLNTLNDGEVEAVIGHELGHVKHHDVQVMMFVSILPAIFYYIYITTFYSAMFSGGRDDRGSGAMLIGMASLVVYFVLTLFTLYLSRLREYFADRHSASVVEDGPRKLSVGLAKIVNSTHKMKHTRPNAAGGNSSLKALFIADPDRAETDSIALSQATAGASDRMLIDEVLKKQVSTTDRLVELFSTHPNIVKRLRALQELNKASA